MSNVPSEANLLKSSRLREAFNIAFLAAAIALVAGFAEVGVMTGRVTIADAFAWTSRDYAWLTPISWLIYFALPALAAALAMAALPSRRVWSVSVAGFVALGAYGLLSLLLHHKLHYGALGLLSVGIGVQAARWGVRHRDVIGERARWVALGLGLLTGGIATVSILWLPANERRLLAQLQEPAAGRPNVLVIILDTVRAASLSLYGYGHRTTPRLEEWARRGVVFDQAWSTSPWSLPGHGTMFTGRYPFEVRGDWEIAFDSEVGTLAERFRDEGYRTGGFVANMYYTAWDSGLDRGFIHYEDYLRSPRQLLLNSVLGQELERVRRHKKEWRASDRRYGPVVTDVFINWLDASAATGRPFFAFLNYFDAHRPYWAPPRFNRAFRRAGSSRRYNRSIAYLDMELDRLFRELQERGMLDNTLIVVTSDHGEFLGEHGLTGHGKALYEPVLRVPLMFLPPIGERRMVDRVSHPVSLRDLAATVLDIAGLPNTLPGVSLRPFWREGRQPDVSPILAQVSKGIRTPPEEPGSKGPMFTLLHGTWHFILNGDCTQELYNLAADPSESDNLIQTHHRDSVAMLQQELWTAFPGVRDGACKASAP